MTWCWWISIMARKKPEETQIWLCCGTRLLRIWRSMLFFFDTCSNPYEILNWKYLRRPKQMGYNGDSVEASILRSQYDTMETGHLGARNGSIVSPLEWISSSSLFQTGLDRVSQTPLRSLNPFTLNALSKSVNVVLTMVTGIIHNLLH